MNMINTDRKRVEEIEARYNEAKAMAYATGKLPEFIDPEKEWLLSIIKSLEEEKERLIVDLDRMTRGTWSREIARLSSDLAKEREETKRLEQEYKMKDKVEKCAWSYDDDYAYYDTTCGQAFVLNDGTLAENNMKFCCYCGKPVKEKRASGVSAIL